MNGSNRGLRFFSIVSMLGLILFFSHRGKVSAAGPWYVKPGGSDGATCLTPANACATINGALGKATSGDTIYVASGSYIGSGSEVVRISKTIILSGGWNSGFTLQNGASRIDGEDVRRVMRIDFDKIVVIEYFVIQNGQYDGAPGIFTDGALTLNYSTVKDNVDIGDWTSEGGGIRNGSGTLTLNYSTVRDNSSSSGAGIFNAWGTLVLYNSTLSGNIASGGGGGINNLGGSVALISSTVSNNSADPVGGIHNEAGGSVTLFNSIVAGNHAGYGPDCNGTFSTLGFNLIGDTANCTFTPSTGDLTDVDAFLGILQDNGGHTQTHALLASRPAIDSGTPSACPSTDQRSIIRPQDGDGDNSVACDIGSFEKEFIPPTSNPILYRFPANIARGSDASGPNQWFAKVVPARNTAEGEEFHFVIWLHIPEDWQLPWARQYSFTGDFSSVILTQDWNAFSWVQNKVNCPYGGPAEAGFKWRALRGPLETMPPLVDRFSNIVNLRGGLGVPSGETPDLYGGVRVIVGTYYDSNADGTPDRYACDNVGVTNITVTD